MNFQRIEAFLSQEINANAMKAVRGGADQRSDITGGGSLCSNLSSTGCVGYTSDTIYYHANGGSHTTYSGCSEVALPC
jgi:hypothetical protein